jgi:hypothetical protein
MRKSNTARKTMTVTQAITQAKKSNKKITAIQLKKIADMAPVPTALTEKQIRNSRQVPENKQLFVIVCSMIKNGLNSKEIFERLNDEQKPYFVGTCKHTGKKTTKAFISKCFTCYNAYLNPNNGSKVSYEFGRMIAGKDVSEGCTFKSNVRLSYAVFTATE